MHSKRNKLTLLCIKLKAKGLFNFIKPVGTERFVMIRAFNLKKFLSSVAYPVGGGVLSAILTSGAMKSYADMSETAAFAAGVGFSRCVDDIIYSYGNLIVYHSRIGDFTLSEK